MGQGFSIASDSCTHLVAGANVMLAMWGVGFLIQCGKVC